MKIHFLYDEEKDIDCLLSKGGGSQNRPGNKTRAYEALLEHVSDPNDREAVRKFVRDYIRWNDIDVQKNLIAIRESWENIAGEFEKRAEKIFGAKIPDAIAAFLTITGRYPYSLGERYSYVPATKSSANKVAMHELWHFYTWQKFGKEEGRLGGDAYNDFKEALTVLLNVECRDLMGEETDDGYPQHRELREKAVEVWNETKNIDAVWKALGKGTTE